MTVPNPASGGGAVPGDASSALLPPALGAPEFPRPMPVVVRSEPIGARAAVEAEPRPRMDIVNRVVNVLIAGTALIIASPVMLLVAVAVKLTSPGAVIYSQTRVGLDRRRRPTNALYDRRGSDGGGRLFTIYKFRSMYQDAEKHSGAVWAKKDDDRVTPLGRFLRVTRLDELPQLMNVIEGDMNIVGPRPERPSIVADLRQCIPEYPLRHRIKPGITGWAQINQQYDACIDDVREQGALRSRVPQQAESGGGREDHVPHRPRHALQAQRLVAEHFAAVQAGRRVGSQVGV